MPAPQLAAKHLMLAIAAIAVSTAASCDLPDTEPINFAFTGRVLDADTKEPIEGAYALAVYEKVDLGMAATARYCVKTKGMFTGKDGRFSFPVEKRDGNSPVAVYAIKADHYFARTETIPSEVWRKQNKEANSNRNVYLKKQDPAKLELRYGYTTCDRPESREAVEANIQFLNIKKADVTRLGINAEWFKNYMANTDSMINDLQSAPNAR